MSDKEFIDGVLSEAWVARVAVSRNSGAPVIRPFWFIWEDGKILITAKTDSIHARIARKNPKICVSVDKHDPPYKAVVCEGEVEIIEGMGKDLEFVRRVAERYLPPQVVEKFLEGPSAKFERVRFIVHPKHWAIWDQTVQPQIPPHTADYV